MYRNRFSDLTSVSVSNDTHIKQVNKNKQYKKTNRVIQRNIILNSLLNLKLIINYYL